MHLSLLFCLAHLPLPLIAKLLLDIILPCEFHGFNIIILITSRFCDFKGNPLAAFKIKAYHYLKMIYDKKSMMFNTTRNNKSKIFDVPFNLWPAYCCASELSSGRFR